MANRRMFSIDIVESDVFLEMPLSSQCLYLHLSMNADDYGFVTPKRIMRMIGATQDDMNILVLKRYLLCFDSGVLVIKHWPINNTVRKDRAKPTTYEKELKSLTFNEFGAYTETSKISEFVRITTNEKKDVENMTTDSNKITGMVNQTTINCQPSGDQMSAQIRLDKIRLDKTSSYNGEKSPAEMISALYYQIIKKMKLPVRNHGNVKSTIKKMVNEKINDENIHYLNFMLNDFIEWKHKYKPNINEALDIYAKRNSVISKLVKSNETRGVKL